MALPDPSQLSEIDGRLSGLSAEDRLRWAHETFGDRAGIGTSFQPAGVVILHLARTAGLPIRAFTLNTGLLFPETIAFKAEIERILGIKVDDVEPEQTVEQQAAAHGPELWKRDPEKCCELRKVQPLGRRLFDLDLWISGLRRDQSAERASTPLLSLAGRPDGSDVWKLNPLVDWSKERVHDYLAAHGLPHNPLIDRGYRSIGCAPCTVPSSGGDERGGRWPGFDKRECGLHTRTKK
ncbi:MAG: phosphoadenylyl-sulfate reductase [Verrucomicrobiota bacterium]